MRGLFEPDIFSASVPRFSPVSRKTAGLLHQICSAFDVAGPIVAIEQSGGNEVNSSNFKVRTSSGDWLLKKLPPAAEASARQGLALMRWLHARGVPIPELACAPDGALMVARQEALWCLMDFVPGRFFAGGDAELTAAANAIGVMQRHLEAAPAGCQPPQRWQYDFSDAADILALAWSGREAWTEQFGAEAAATLEARWPDLAALARRLREARPGWSQRPCSPCHADLHPHNILVDRGRVSAFVDFEAFSLVPPAAALGFATYKLTRQWAAAEVASRRGPEQIAGAGVRFLSALAEGAGGTQPSPADLHAGACAEVFRRLLLVLRLNAADQNRAWNHVLPIHLAGMAELDVIFGGSPSFE